MKSAHLIILVLTLAAGIVVGWVGASIVHDAARPAPAPSDPPLAPPIVAGRDSGLVPATRPVAVEGGVSVYFSPNGGCTAAILREISAARRRIYVQANSFNSAPIAKALAAARERGVDVQVLVDQDKSQDKTQADRLSAAGVPTYTDGRHNSAHNKVMTFDGEVLITGSFNFTRESESENAENLVVIRDHPAIVAAYDANFGRHLVHSEKYRK